MRTFNNSVLAIVCLLVNITFAQSATIVVESNTDNGDLSLRNAVITAQAGDTITFDALLNEIPVFLTSTNQITIDKDLTVIGNGITNTIIDANLDGRIFEVLPTINFTLSNITLMNANLKDISADGAAINNSGNVTLNNCKFENNQAEKGGAIFNLGNLNITACKFISNFANTYGGAIFDKGFAAENNKMEIRRAHFAMNTSNNDGGAIYNDGYGGISSPVVINSIFSGNFAEDKGGAIYNNGYLGIANPLFLNCTFFENGVNNNGSCVYSYGNLGTSNPSFVNSIIWSNKTTTTLVAKNAAATTLNHCLINTTECPTGVNCDEQMIYNQNPQFVTNPAQSTSLMSEEAVLTCSASPSVNGGCDTYTTQYSVTEDFFGNTRVMGGGIDIGANEAIVDLTPQLHTLNLKVLLEGPYNTMTGLMNTHLAQNNLIPTNSPYNNDSTTTISEVPSNMVDWVMIQVQNTNGETIAEQAALLLADGTIIDTEGYLPEFMAPVSTEYFVVIRHRNHLDIISNATTATGTSATQITIDFTTNTEKAMGPQQLTLTADNKAAMFAGDVNNDLAIQSTDFDLWKSNPAVLNTYASADMNLDGSIQATDYDSWHNNRSKLGLTQLAQ